MLTLGIIGGGQLGKMSAQAAKQLGMTVFVLDPDPHAPAGQVCDLQFTGRLDDAAKLHEIVKNSQVISYDIEHIDTAPLLHLARQGARIEPSPEVLSLIQDKLLQKCRLQAAAIPVPDFVEQIGEDPAQFRQFGFPLVQKTRRGGYDGRGVRVLRSEADLAQLLEGPCMLERCVDIVSEVAVMVARSKTGQIRSYPVVDMTFHAKGNVLDEVFAPSSAPAALQAQARQIAEETVSALGGIGIFGVELFVDRAGKLWVNEVAPRPHNSGHYTIEACVTSQFEQHVRAVCGLPLGDTSLVRPAVMINLLGEEGSAGPVVIEGLEASLQLSGVSFHLYGKRESRPGRKMGHVTVTAATMAEARQIAAQVKAQLKIKGSHPL